MFERYTRLNSAPCWASDTNMMWAHDLYGKTGGISDPSHNADFTAAFGFRIENIISS